MLEHPGGNVNYPGESIRTRTSLAEDPLGGSELSPGSKCRVPIASATVSNVSTLV